MTLVHRIFTHKKSERSPSHLPPPRTTQLPSGEQSKEVAGCDSEPLPQRLPQLPPSLALEAVTEGQALWELPWLLTSTASGQT